MACRMGLGKGLEALIPGNENNRGGNGIESIPIEKISPNPRQPRTSLNPDDLAELATSIKEHGVPPTFDRLEGPSNRSLYPGRG